MNYSNETKKMSYLFSFSSVKIISLANEIGLLHLKVILQGKTTGFESFASSEQQAAMSIDPKELKI